MKNWMIVLLVAAVAVAHAEPSRRALVVGNDSYAGNGLKNARNDATGVADALKSIGYSTTLVLDANQKALAHAVDEFSDSIEAGDIVVFYYAGHGFQLAGENYLVPTDFVVGTPEEAKHNAYPLSSLLERLTAHGALTQVVILDACRDNPFLGSRSTRGGWASLGTSAGTFLAFGTSPGSTASDDPSQPHGLFTLSLLKYMTSSQLDIEQMFQQVRLDVIRQSEGHQVPWTASSLVGTLHILPQLDQNAPQIASLPEITETDIGPTPAARQVTAATAVPAPAVASPAPAVSAPVQPLPPPTQASAVSGAQLVAQGITEAQSGQLEAALKTLNTALTMNPGDPHIARLLGLVYQMANQSSPAGQMLNQAVTADPKDPNGYIERCIVSGSSDASSAVSDCQTAITLAPNSAGARFAFAALLLAMDKGAQAYAEASKGIELASMDPFGFALRGRIASALGYKGIAKEDYQKAVKLKLSADRTQK